MHFVYFTDCLVKLTLHSHLNAFYNGHSPSTPNNHHWIEHSVFSFIPVMKWARMYTQTAIKQHVIRAFQLYTLSATVNHSNVHIVSMSLPLKCIPWGCKELSNVISKCTWAYVMIWVGFWLFSLLLPPPWFVWQDLFPTPGLWQWQWVLSINLRQQLLFSEDFLWPHTVVSTK